MVIRCHKKCSTRIHSYRNHNLVFYVDCDDSLASHICKMLMFGSANIQRFFRHPDCSVGSTSSYTNWWHLRGGFQGGRPGGSADQGCDFGGGKHGLKMVEVGLKSEWVTCDTYFKISRIWEFGTFGPLILFVGAKRSVGVLQEIFGAHRNSLMCCWRRTGLCSDMFPEERSNPLSSSRIRPIHALFARGCPHRKTPGSIRHLPSGGALWCGTQKEVDHGGPVGNWERRGRWKISCIGSSPHPMLVRYRKKIHTGDHHYFNRCRFKDLVCYHQLIGAKPVFPMRDATCQAWNAWRPLEEIEQHCWRQQRTGAFSSCAVHKKRAKHGGYPGYGWLICLTRNIWGQWPRIGCE